MKRLDFFCRIILAGMALLALFAGVRPGTTRAAYGFNDPAFARQWGRLDTPVEGFEAPPRGYIWGPPIAGSGRVTTETYDGAARTVEYFDKARMEINPQIGDPNNPWHITTGLLVEEMVLGRIQTGDNSFTTTAPNPAVVAGDPNNPLSPFYASFKNLLGSTSDRTGQPITRQLDATGQVSIFQPPESRLLTNFDTVTGHNLADVFVSYFRQSGPVANGNGIEDDQLFKPNALYFFGHPITEPYWTRAIVAGKEQAVLVQLFERRTLTYTPANTPANRVEMGNVGQHYFAWRYQPLTDEACRQGMPQPRTAVSPAQYPSDFSQAAASYLASGPVPVGGPGNVFHYTTGLNYTGPYLAVTQDGGLAVFGANKQGLIALRLTDNPNQTCEAWRYSPPDAVFYGEPLLYNGLAIISDTTGTLHAIRLSDGTPVWTRKQPHQVYAVGTPITDGTNLYFAGATDEGGSSVFGPSGGHLYAVRLSNGGLVWESPNIYAAGGRVIFGFDGNLFFGGVDAAVYGYTRDGQSLPGWPSQSFGFASRPTRVDNFTFANDRLYVSIGRLYALDRNGQTVDTYQPDTNQIGSQSVTLPTIVGDTVYVGVTKISDEKTPEGQLTNHEIIELRGLNAHNFKKERFRFHTDFPPGTELTVLDGYVYFGAAERFFQVRADNSGFNRQMFLAGGAISSTPVVRNGRAYVLASDGNFYIVR